MKRRISLILIFSFILSQILSGCGESDDGATAMQVYFLNIDRNAFVEASVDIPDSADIRTQADLLIEAMYDDFAVPSGAEKLIADESMLIATEINDRVISFYLNGAYDRLSASDRFLIRAGLVKIFTQIKGITGVSIFVNGEEAKDSYGNVIGVSRSSDFVENPSKEINEYINKTMALYFSDSTGTALVKESRKVYYSSNVPVEQVVVTELIKGPYETGRLAVFPTDLNVLNVTIQDDICYVNFDDSISIAALTEIDPYVQIYSIVNSISAVCGVTRVSFSMNGSSDYLYAGEISFENIFEPRKDLIVEVDED